MAGRRSALIVDDIESNRTMLKSFLFFFGFDAELAADGLIARKALETKAFDLVVSDIEMPNMNGFELLSWLRKSAVARTPCIMLSSLESAEVVERCKRLGANAYIVKPFTREKMAAALESSGLG